MTRDVRRLGRRSTAAALAAVLLAAMLPNPGTANPGSAALAAAAAPVAATPAAATPAAATPAAANAQVADAGSGPSIMYEQAMEHASDVTTFVPGDRVVAGFVPRAGDTWTVGGAEPVALPAGTESGRALAATPEGVAPASVPMVTTQDLAVLAPSVAAPALRRQVFGFLPYWQVSGAASRLNYAVLSTIAYFSVGSDRLGNLKKLNADGTTTTGWGGWTSAAMTAVINEAHSNGTRVVLTISVFGWTTSELNVQKALLGSATARANLAKQIAAAVHNRGADGVNLDLEPLAAGYEAQFVSLVAAIRTALNALHRGYQITFDTMGRVGNYPLASAIGPTAADAVFVMAYDYRTSSSATSGSIDALSGPTYDLTDTVRTYVAQIAPSRVILGIPWYGRAWSTASSQPRAATLAGAKYGYSSTVTYDAAVELAHTYGRLWDSVEKSPWFVYQRQNCTTAYGCVTSARQVWYGDSQSMALRYALVNDYGLRGAGIWALGYDGAHPELNKALADAFLVDHSAPQAGIANLAATQTDEGFVVSWAASDVSTVKSYDVQAATDGGGWLPWLTATKATTDVWLGSDGHAYAFRVRATDSKGNRGAWNVTSVWDAAPALAVGGFGRVTAATLTYRTGPTVLATSLGSLATGTKVAFTSGPVSADGYTWYEVTQPIAQWSPVSFVERGVWIAVASAGTTYVTAIHAPNTAKVDAGLAGLDFGAGGATGAANAALRAFSPNADGSRDTLRIRWTSTVALAGLTLNVRTPAGVLVGSVPLAASAQLAVGAHTFDWDGRLGGTTVTDGRYLLQLVGTTSSRTYSAPSAVPATAALLAVFGVTIDTVAPKASSATASSSLISPNGDGRRETAAYALKSSGAAVAWSVDITNSSNVQVRHASGAGSAIAFTWDGRSDGAAVVADGSYTVRLAACDAAGNCARRSFPIGVDTTPPAIVPAAPAAFSPNGDGTADSASFRWTSPEAFTGTVMVLKGSKVLRSWSLKPTTTGHVAWNGRTIAGLPVANGGYTMRITGMDAAGNRTVVTAPVVVDRTAGFLRWTGDFYPQDGDRLMARSTLRWTLTRSATTTLGIYSAAGSLVRTVWTGRAQTAGARAWTWDGTLDGGVPAPQGRYTARLLVTSPWATQQLVRSVWASAFSTTLSASTVHAGHVLTLTFATVEPLLTRPRVTFTQPGAAAVAVTATKLANGTYRVRFTVAAGPAGTAVLHITARDRAGHPNAMDVSVAVAG